MLILWEIVTPRCYKNHELNNSETPGIFIGPYSTLVYNENTISPEGCLTTNRVTLLASSLVKWFISWCWQVQWRRSIQIIYEIIRDLTHTIYCNTDRNILKTVYKSLPKGREYYNIHLHDKDFFI